MEGRKRVLVFIPQFPVLTETFIQREISRLVERGNVDIAVVSLRPGKGELFENLKDRVFYKRLTWGTSFKALFYFFTKLPETIKAFNMLQRGKLYVFLKSLGYAKIFEIYKPDLILAHFMSQPSTIAMVASKILDVPYAISAHAKDVTVDAEYVSEKVKTAKFILICNKNARDFLIKLSGKSDPQNVYLRYHGIDFKNIVNKVSQTEIKKQVPLILSVGRLTEKKGHKYLIEASKILKDRKIAHQVEIVGPGHLYKKLFMQIKKLKLEDRVSLPGKGEGVPFSETLKRFKAADVFVLPGIETSSGDVDGIANVLLEAAVFKLPIVATDAGSTLEVVENQKTGIVVPQRDSEKLANGIQVVLQNKDFAKELGENAYNKVKNMFSLDKNVAEIEKLLLS